MNTDKVSEMLNNRMLSEKAAYSDEGVALFESTDRMTTVRNVNIDALLLGLCQSGHATLTIDGVEHEVSTYDLLVCLPGMTISRSETSGDISGCCICMSKDYVQQLSQMNSVDALNRSFNDDLKALVGAADADRKALLDNAVANDFKRMSYVLTPAQLSKYEILINATLANRGMEK